MCNALFESILEYVLIPMLTVNSFCHCARVQIEKSEQKTNVPLDGADTTPEQLN